MNKMDMQTASLALLNKINIAYNLLFDLSSYKIPNSIEECLISDTKEESYRMLIVNYIVALIGKKRNDKISVFNNPIDNKKEHVEKFYITHADDIKNLCDVRDKVYSHFDIDFPNRLKNIEFDFIKTCIKFLNELLEYNGDIKPN